MIYGFARLQQILSRPLPAGYSTVFNRLLFPSHSKFCSLFEFEMGIVDGMTRMLVTDDNNGRAYYYYYYYFYYLYLSKYKYIYRTLLPTTAHWYSNVYVLEFGSWQWLSYVYPQPNRNDRIVTHARKKSSFSLHPPHYPVHFVLSCSLSQLLCSMTYVYNSTTLQLSHSFPFIRFYLCAWCISFCVKTLHIASHWTTCAAIPLNFRS